MSLMKHPYYRNNNGGHILKIIWLIPHTLFYPPELPTDRIDAAPAVSGDLGY